MQSNIYVKAINEAAEDVSNSNKAKMQKVATLTLDKSAFDMLKAQNVDAKRFNARAIYATEKCVKFVHALTREQVAASEFNENAFATFKTLCAKIDAKQTVSKRDIECALSKDQKLADEKSAIYRRKSIFSAQTLAAQSQQCVDMIKTLNVVKEVARNVFEVNAECELMKLAREKMKDLAL